MPPTSPRKLAVLLGASLLALCGVGPARADTVEQMRARLPWQEVISFVLPDRLANGDPANDRGGLPAMRDFAFTRAADGALHAGAGVPVAFNTWGKPSTTQVEAESLHFKTLAVACPQAASAAGSVAPALPAFGYAVCAAARDT